ncbi:hypothetical protein MKX03_025551 [Papaver bracteatum]|nr:hypothetical protein MKX03_025551 [Papaver bracteatum]
MLCYRWRIKDVSKWDEQDHATPIFTLGLQEWKLVAFYFNGYLSFYIYTVGCKDSRFARFRLAILNQMNNHVALRKAIVYSLYTEGIRMSQFEEESGWSFVDFIQLRDLNNQRNGYVIGDACIIEVQVFLNSIGDAIKDGRTKTKNREKLGKDSSSSVQRSNWDKNGSVPNSSESRMDDQPISHITPKLKESDGYGKYSINEIKERYHLDERFEVEFIEGEDKLTDALVKNFPCNKNNLLIAVGQLEAGLRLPLYYPDNPFYYEVLSQRADKRGIFQYNGNFFRFLRECRKRSKGCTGITSIVPQFRREDYTATNFNWTWDDHTSRRNRFPWCVGPRRIPYSQRQDFSGKAELLPEYKGEKRFDMVRLDHDEKWFRTPLRIKGPWVTGWLTSDARTIFDAYPPYEPWTLNIVASPEVTSVPPAADGSDGDGDDPDLTPLVCRKRQPSPGDQTVENTSAKSSRPYTLDVSLESEVTSLKPRMQRMVTREEADASLAKPMEATNVQFLQHADVQLQLAGNVEYIIYETLKDIGVQEYLAIANARIHELESLNQAQAQQHAHVQLRLEGNVADLESQLNDNAERAKEIIKLAESFGMMKPGEKSKHC